MGLTALQVRGEGLGADSAGYQAGEYRGATTAARFGDPQAEFAAMRHACGVYDLGYRTKIAVTGGDRVRWLNGMVTNNIRDLAAGQGVYAFLLSPQGHILGDLYAYNRGESFLVDTDARQAEKILASFDHYIIMDDVDLAPQTELTALGVSGPKAREVLRAVDAKVPELQPLQLHAVECDCDCGCLNCTFVRGDDPGIESYEILLASEHVRALWDALRKAGAIPVGSEGLELRRIALGLPVYGVDIRERDLPQETEQARALNFNKGCYIGQEIVERIRSRGAVHRKFSGFLAEGAAPITPGSKVIHGEKEIGEITSVASFHSAAGEKTIALGFIRREAGVPGREVMIASVPAKVIPLPVPEDVFEKEGSMMERPA